MRELPRKDYYGALRLPHGASDAVVRRRFNRLARRLHPDVTRAPDAAERFPEAREAYEILMDPASRALVDSWFEPHARSRRIRRSRCAPAPAESTPLAPGQRRPFSPFWTAGGDRAWNFGWAASLAFVCALLAALGDGATLEEAAAFAAVVALVIGLAAAFGGAWIRERLLWLLEWWW